MFRPARASASQSDDADAGERFTRALVALTRTVWSPDCTFETAIAAICQTAASALQIERVSVWRYDAGERVLRCLHAYDAIAGQGIAPDALETLPLDEDDYIASFDDVRTLEVAVFERDAWMARSHLALRDYLQRHRIHGVLDAPAFVGGALQGMVCHESLAGARIWSRAETTFAASMGDYVAMAFEIARRRRAEAEVEHLRLHDVATGLPNRAYMIELIRQRFIDGPSRRHELLAVVHVQVDVSTGRGCSAGAPSADTVMGRIAQVLRPMMGVDTELARTGVDGFSFLVSTHASNRTVIRLAEAILGMLESMDWPHADLEPGASIGIAVAEQAGARNPLLLLQQGEEAAAQARAAGRFGHAVYDTEHHTALLEALRFERAMRDGFARGEFEVHYQPEYDTALGQWVAAEALLRWRVGGALRTAAEFIGVLEPSRLMPAVGRWVLRQACQDAAAWPARAGEGAPGVRVNVSARQFDETGLVEDVQASLDASGLDPARLTLELTETTLMRDIDHALEILRPLRALGVQVAIDDFGTGYASLVYLKRLPVDALKIDREFVQGMPDSAADLAIVRAVIGLAEAFAIEVIAEGVETPAQAEALNAAGVHRMQGWLYGKAMPNIELCRMLGVKLGPTDTSPD
ncbi:putative bifunctional diguanylate cyclase/phosphodiesterase [Luteimonas terrae]|uniref:Diguanylate cyclase (GGDEF)-like protein n=1 Tax=Luteimonas terrae TaxID=1530191 RepID=A0ABU1XXV4_9GAMM|nr:sensor domain-containing phosphodiesterase [Luteimonas terrae]MDR7193591.1 diguanylate cyclase (GGDEF)-like protein [Luteimonas terrae]